MNKLFTLIGFQRITKIGVFLINTALLVRLPIKKLIKISLFKQFCGGENLEECVPAMNKLYQYGIQAIPDYSVEGGHGEEEHTVSQILETIDFVAREEAASFAVFKFTGIADPEILMLGEKSPEWTKVKTRAARMAKAAFDQQVYLLVDAEETWLQDSIDQLSVELMKRYNRQSPTLWMTFQMYRHDALTRLKAAYAEAKREGYHLGVKLVRGAYMEKERKRAAELQYPDPIFSDKIGTDQAYDEALKFCVEHLDHIALCAGTHNENSNRLLVRLMQEHQIDPHTDRIHFAQLYGMSDHISYNLAAAGYRVSKYLPFGPVRLVMPYLFRRAEENTSVSGQSSRELVMIRKEMARRSNKS